MEKCDKCGDIGEDRRTLWMACFYEMSELDVPFQKVAIRGVRQQQVGSETSELTGGDLPVFADGPEAQEQQHRFYTLRVCKECRASWMQGIADWYHAPTEQRSTGTGVFGRRNGTTYEMTEAEIEERWPGTSRADRDL